MESNEKDKRDGREQKPKENAITRLYDKIPVTYKQVDIFVKVMLGLIFALLIYGIVKGGM